MKIKTNNKKNLLMKDFTQVYSNITHPVLFTIKELSK